MSWTLVTLLLLLRCQRTGAAASAAAQADAAAGGLAATGAVASEAVGDHGSELGCETA